MKGVIGLAAFLVVAFWAWNYFFASMLMADQGKNLAIAFNQPYASVFEIQVGIGPLTAMHDPPRSTPKGVLLWQEWIDEHFQLRDSAGNRVPLKRIGTSALFTGSKGGGDPDFVLVGEIAKQTAYEFDFIPVLSEKKTYRYEFTSPADAEGNAGWRNFALADES